MNLRGFAFVVSRIFDFYFWLPIGLLITILNTGLRSEQIKVLLPILVMLDIVLPVSLFILVLKRKIISDIDVTKREERPLLFATMTFILFVSTIVSFLLGNNLFYVLNFASFVIALTLFLATLKFKISGHALMNASSIFVINYLLHWQALWLFLIIPFVVFARLYLKKHTWAQVLLGLILGVLEPYLILRGFNFI